MATRFYLPSTGAAEVSPPYTNGGVGYFVWNKISEADRLKMVRTKISSAFAIKTCSENVATEFYNILNRQYVSAPIGAHDFTGCTFKAQVRCMEDAAKADFVLYQLQLRIVSNDGQTIRHVLSMTTNSYLEFDDDVLENRRLPASAVLADKSSQNGDRLVLEVGIRAANTKTTLYTATMDFGDASGTDLPENETETAQYNPWIEFSHDIPEASGDEFVYAGDVPVGLTPSTPKGIMSMVYGGDVPLSAMPSYASILDRVYAGAVPLAMLPDAPIAPLEKSYAGAVGFALVPNSTYGLLYQYVYAGAVAMGLAPSYMSILDRLYAGDVPMSLTPSSTRILDRIYSGAIPLVALPVFPKAVLEKSYAGDVGLVLVPNSTYSLEGGTEFVYAGDIPLIALPSYASILDRVYQGAVGLNILPDFPKALLAKAYAGALVLVLTPDSAYLLESPVSEFIYAGDIPMSLLPDFSSGLEKAYGGDIGFILMPGSLYSGIRVGPAVGSQISKEESELFLIEKPDEIISIGIKKPAFIGTEKPIFISKK